MSERLAAKGQLDLGTANDCDARLRTIAIDHLDRAQDTNVHYVENSSEPNCVIRA